MADTNNKEVNKRKNQIAVSFTTAGTSDGSKLEVAQFRVIADLDEGRIIVFKNDVKIRSEKMPIAEVAAEALKIANSLVQRKLANDAMNEVINGKPSLKDIK